MYDNAHLDTTLRNLDPRVGRGFKAQASLEGRTIGEAVDEAIRAYAGRPGRHEAECIAAFDEGFRGFEGIRLIPASSPRPS